VDKDQINVANPITDLPFGDDSQLTTHIYIVGNSLLLGNNHITPVIYGISPGARPKAHFQSGLHLLKLEQWKLRHQDLASQGAEKPQMASILGTNLIQPLIQKGELV